MYSNLFSPESIEELTTALQTQFLPAIWETFYVTLLSTAFAIVIGLPLGVLLVVGERDGVLPLPRWLMSVLNVLINLLRSIPFLILMIRSSSRPFRSSRVSSRAACVSWTPTSSRPRRAWAQRPCRSSAR